MSKAIGNVLRAGALAYSFLRARNLVHNDTMSSKAMSVRRTSMRRSYRSMGRVPRPIYPRRNPDQIVRNYTRHTLPFPLALTSGSLGYIKDIKLSDVNVNDIINAYSYYRILGVTAIVTPRNDAAASSPLTNTLHALMANDQSGENASVTNISQVTSFSNHKYKALLSGSNFYYKFYPKLSNAVGSNGSLSYSAAATQGKYNMWLDLDSAGIEVLHNRLLIFIYQTGAVTPANVVDVVYRINFQCKGNS